MPEQVIWATRQGRQQIVCIRVYYGCLDNELLLHYVRLCHVCVERIKCLTGNACLPAGPLFAVVLGAAALGSSLVFSTAAVFILVPLAVATLALTFGLSAGAFVIKGIAFSVFNLVSQCTSFSL